MIRSPRGMVMERSPLHAPLEDHITHAHTHSQTHVEASRSITRMSAPTSVPRSSGASDHTQGLETPSQGGKMPYVAPASAKTPAQTDNHTTLPPTSQASVWSCTSSHVDPFADLPDDELNDLLLSGAIQTPCSSATVFTGSQPGTPTQPHTSTAQPPEPCDVHGVSGVECRGDNAGAGTCVGDGGMNFEQRQAVFADPNTPLAIIAGGTRASAPPHCTISTHRRSGSHVCVCTCMRVSQRGAARRAH